MSKFNQLPAQESEKSRADRWVNLYISKAPNAKAEAKAIILEEKRRMHREARESVDAEFAKIARSVG